MEKQDKYSVNEVVNVGVVRLANKLSLIFFKEALKPIGLSLQEWRTMVNLARVENSHLRKLARLSGIDPAHTSSCLVLLEKKGLVESFTDNRDSRRKMVRLTSQGQALVEEIWPQAKALSQALRNKVGEDKMDAFLDILHELNDFAQDKLDQIASRPHQEAAE